MAKTIKFNLICDDKPVRTIEDLQNNFSIEDVLEYYDNKLLHRWLEVRGFTEELEKVNAIATEKPIEIIKELIKIFAVVCDEKKVEESVYMLEYLDERKELCAIYDKENYKSKSIIDDYETGYVQLVEGIVKNPDDVAKIKANIVEMVNNYAWVLHLNHRNVFYYLKATSMLAIMCLLMNEQSRKYYLPIETKNEDGTVVLDTTSNDDKAAMFQQICSMISTSDFKTKLGDNLKSFSGVTDGYWKDLEPKGKRYMIICMGSGDFVRSAGLSGGDLSRTDVNNKFVIVDGIDYKSNSSTRQLVYMEV
jgi:hypothetical protein